MMVYWKPLHEAPASYNPQPPYSRRVPILPNRRYMLCVYYLLSFIHLYMLYRILLLQNFGKEILADEKGDLKYDKVSKILEAASGAAYGTGK